MSERKSPETNDAPRRRPTHTPRPLALLALAATCAAATAAQQPRPAATPAAEAAKTVGATRPAQAGAREKPGTAKHSRARRVAAAPDARPQQQPAPAASPAGKAAPPEKPARAAKIARPDDATAAAESGSENVGESESKDEAKKTAAGVKKTAADAAARTSPPPSAEEEIEKLRAELKTAGDESRARLQRALVERLVALGRNADALSELRLMIHSDAYDPAFFYNTGNALARLGDANAAADAYRKAVSQRRGNYARALNNLGVVLTRQGRWDEAHDALTAALTQENFTYAEASYNLGRLHLLRGQTNLALREWSRTLRLQPDHTGAAAALARAHAEEGDEERAVAVLERFTARLARTGAAVPREIAYARDAVAAARADSRGDARPAVAARTPDTASTDTANATAAPRAAAPAPRDPSPARRFELDRAAYGVLQTAREAGDRGRYDEAARRYRDVIARSGGYFPPANLELGYALANLGRTEEAAAAVRPVVERDTAGRFPAAHYHLARLSERLGRNEEAARHFARAAELYGDANPQMLLDLSRVREKTGDTRGALEAVEAYSVAIAKQGSVPHWVVERADTLRTKLRAAPTRP